MTHFKEAQIKIISEETKGGGTHTAPNLNFILLNKAEPIEEQWICGSLLIGKLIQK